MSMSAKAMVLQGKIAEDFRGFLRNTKLWASLKICILQESGFEELELVLFGRLFLETTHSVLQKKIGQTIYWSTEKPWTNPTKHLNDLESSKFC